MPSPTALVTLEEALDELRLSPTAVEQASLDRLVDAVSDRFDQLIGATVIRQIEERWEDAAAYRTGLGPLQGFVTIEDAGSTIPEDALTLVSRGSASRWLARYDWVGPTRIVWLAGRVSSTAEVPSRIKAAALLTIRHLWRSYQAAEMTEMTADGFVLPTQAFPRWAIPDAALDLVEDLLSAKRVPGLA